MQAKFGEFLFELNGTNLDKLKRSLTFNFATQQRLGNFNAYQAVGAYEEAVEITGTLLAKSINQMSDFETMGKNKKTFTLALGSGEVMSAIILNLELERESFLRDGAYLKQTYKVALQRVDDENS